MILIQITTGMTRQEIKQRYGLTYRQQFDMALCCFSNYHGCPKWLQWGDPLAHNTLK
jgi:hypothetical protein